VRPYRRASRLPLWPLRDRVQQFGHGVLKFGHFALPAGDSVVLAAVAIPLKL
jgi:hypothetical protein